MQGLTGTGVAPSTEATSHGAHPSRWRQHSGRLGARGIRSPWAGHERRFPAELRAQRLPFPRLFPTLVPCPYVTHSLGYPTALTPKPP